MPKGTLIAAMNIGRAAEDEFQDWYDTEHLPERQRVPGFLACERWIGADDPCGSRWPPTTSSSGQVLQSPGYLAIGGENLSPWSKRVTSQVERLMRFEGDQILPDEQLPPTKARWAAAERHEYRARARGRVQRVVRQGAHPGAGRRAGRAGGAPLPRHPATASTSRSITWPRPRWWSRPNGSRPGRASGRARLQPHFRDHLRLVTAPLPARSLIMLREITATALAMLLADGSTLALIDVREPGEYNLAHIAGSSSVPRRQLESRIGRLVPYRGVAGGRVRRQRSPRRAGRRERWSAWAIGRCRRRRAASIAGPARTCPPSGA